MNTNNYQKEKYVHIVCKYIVQRYTGNQTNQTEKRGRKNVCDKI